MRMKINLGAKTNMGSTSTPRPNQRYQQVPWAYRRSTISFFSGQQALRRLAERNFVLNALSSGTLWHGAMARYGTLWHLLCELCGLWPRVTMGSYDHVEYLYTFWKRIPPLSQLCTIVPKLARARHAIRANRINVRASVYMSGTTQKHLRCLI